MKTKTTATIAPSKSATREKPITIGFGISNVLNNFTEHFIEFYNNTEKPSSHILRFEEVTDWSLFKCIPEDNRDTAFNVIMNREFYKTLQHNETAFNVLSKLNKLPNIQLAIIGNQFSIDYPWLWEHFPFLRPEEIICANIGVNIMFDDFPVETTDEFEYDYYMIDRPWNQETTSGNTQYTRIYNWDDIEEILAVRYSILPTLTPATTFINTKTENKVPLYEKIMNCKSKEDLATLLEPHLKTVFESGYTTALADMATVLRELSKNN